MSSKLNGVKAEVLAAGADGLRNVLGLGGRHHEDDVRGRLFEGLEQSIEGRFGDLVRLVEDVDLVAVTGRCVPSGIAQFANLIDTAIGGCVDFDDVDCVTLTNLGARFAHAAGLGGRPVRAADLAPAVERLGEDAGDGGFADAAMPGKDIAVGDAVLGQSVQQRPRDVVLAGNVGETLRTVFSGQNLVTHGECRSYCRPNFRDGSGAIVTFRGGRSGSPDCAKLRPIVSRQYPCWGSS